jgi:murein DD-endopeptidase MepM/ murein hydrolase activator NlpD
MKCVCLLVCLPVAANDANIITMKRCQRFLALGLILSACLIATARCGSAEFGSVRTEAPSTGPTPTTRAALFPTSTPTVQVLGDSLRETATRTRPPAPVRPTRTALSTSTPTQTSAAEPPTPTQLAITYSPDGRYAFPVAGDLKLMTWTHYHWDGGNAVDIDAARHLAGDSEAFNTFINLPVAAVTSGTVSIVDNTYGGLALLLRGQDGQSYYYGHLSEQWVEEDQTVGVGDLMGRIGNTGLNSQYIEPHLHFTVSSSDATDLRLEPDINAAEQLLTWFDLTWQDLNIPEYPRDTVSGWPVHVPAEITRPFTEPLPENPDQGSIDIIPAVDAGDPLPVYATVGGEVNVNRATVIGLRTQITNRPARTTVVYSFLSATTVSDGDVVAPGDVIGYIDPTVGLNYMLFVNDTPTDPAPTLGDAPQP